MHYVFRMSVLLIGLISGLGSRFCLVCFIEVDLVGVHTARQSRLSL